MILKVAARAVQLLLRQLEGVFRRNQIRVNVVCDIAFRIVERLLRLFKRMIVQLDLFVDLCLLLRDGQRQI